MRLSVISSPTAADAFRSNVKTEQYKLTLSS